jgi:hypothetical protein
MDDQAGRLVHDEAVVVLVKDRQGNGFGGIGRERLRRDHDPDPGSPTDGLAGLPNRHAVDRDAPLLEEALEPAPAERQEPGERAIDPVGRLRDGDLVHGLRPAGRRAQRSER